MIFLVQSHQLLEWQAFPRHCSFTDPKRQSEAAIGALTLHHRSSQAIRHMPTDGHSRVHLGNRRTATVSPCTARFTAPRPEIRTRRVAVSLPLPTCTAASRGPRRLMWMTPCSITLQLYYNLAFYHRLQQFGIPTPDASLRRRRLRPAPAHVEDTLQQSD